MIKIKKQCVKVRPETRVEKKLGDRKTFARTKLRNKTRPNKRKLSDDQPSSSKRISGGFFDFKISPVLTLNKVFDDF